MNAPGVDRRLLKPARDVGITGYGAYIPRFRLPAKEVARVWKGGQGGLPVKEKAVSGIDEDVITMSIEAARNALARGQVDPSMIRAVWVGSESHPYSVKPTSTVVAEAIGATPHTQAADWQFACKAGTEAVQAAIGFVGSGMADYALSIGMDTAGYFWRRADEKYPEHGERFTGEPAYFKHIQEAGSALMQTLGRRPEDFRYAVFHQPNTKFPQRAAKSLGFKPEQIETGLLAPVIGNTYAGSALVGLTAILDEAAPGDRILLVSYGSGAGSDAFSLVATERLPQRRGLAPSTREYIARRTEIDYATYARYRGKLTLS